MFRRLTFPHFAAGKAAGKTVSLIAHLLILSVCAGYTTANADSARTQSKRIEVYALSQNYWDTQYGDTLGEIAHHLLPHNPSKRRSLEQDILHLNPDAFIDGNPAKLLADKRLWLPGYINKADSKADPATTTVERYSWGNIKRPK